MNLEIIALFYEKEKLQQEYISKMVKIWGIIDEVNLVALIFLIGNEGMASRSKQLAQLYGIFWIWTISSTNQKKREKYTKIQCYKIFLPPRSS